MFSTRVYDTPCRGNEDSNYTGPNLLNWRSKVESFPNHKIELNVNLITYPTCTPLINPNRLSSFIIYVFISSSHSLLLI